MRNRARGSVLRAMPGIAPVQLPLALWLLAGAQPVVPGIAPQLPDGKEAALRAHPTAHAVPAPRRPAPYGHAGPAALPRISSGFGTRRDPIHGARRMHSGIDIPGAPGSRVRASAGGVVRFAGARGGYGNMVEIDHGGGLSTRYGHLSRILVPAGTRVSPGETIALMGATGRATGSHLHFELRSQGRAMDPLPLMSGARPPQGNALAADPEPHVSDFARARAAGRQPERNGL